MGGFFSSMFGDENIEEHQDRELSSVQSDRQKQNTAIITSFLGVTEEELKEFAKIKVSEVIFGFIIGGHNKNQKYILGYDALKSVSKEEKLKQIKNILDVYKNNKSDINILTSTKTPEQTNLWNKCFESYIIFTINHFLKTYFPGKAIDSITTDKKEKVMELSSRIYSQFKYNLIPSQTIKLISDDFSTFEEHLISGKEEELEKKFVIFKTSVPWNLKDKLKYKQIDSKNYTEMKRKTIGQTKVEQIGEKVIGVCFEDCFRKDPLECKYSFVQKNNKQNEDGVPVGMCYKHDLKEGENVKPNNFIEESNSSIYRYGHLR